MHPSASRVTVDRFLFFVRVRICSSGTKLGIILCSAVLKLPLTFGYMSAWDGDVEGAVEEEGYMVGG